MKEWDLIINPERGWLSLNSSEIFHYKDLLWLFVKRDFTTFYKQTILGPLWFFVQPLLSTIVFSIILVHLGFLFLSKLLKSKFTQGQLSLAKIFFEYSLLAWIVYYIFI